MQARNRRVFMLHAITGATALAVQSTVQAQAAEPAQTASDVPVKETDASPKSMGYRLDPANVDKLGTRSFFKRPVPPGGWCRNFKPKKAAA